MTPRGVRNHNPGNLRKTKTEWVGELVGSDAEFEVFDTAEHGIRALARVLLTYQEKHHCRTIGQFISRYAPAAENDTPGYVRHVARQMGCVADEPIDLHDRERLTALVKAIIRHENGRRPDGRDWYDDETIARGVEMAGGASA